MVTAIQDPKETAQQFLLRLLDARNRVFFAAKEERAEGEYSSQLIEKSFLKAFESGLRDENLVTNLHPFLRAREITDDELMKNVNELATRQQERKMKIGATSERSKTAKAQAFSSVKAGFHLNECNDSAEAARVGACVVGSHVDSPAADLGRIG